MSVRARRREIDPVASPVVEAEEARAAAAEAAEAAARAAAVAAEAAARTAAVSAEASTRAAADATAAAALATEVTNRTADVNAEEAARVAGDAAIGAALALLQDAATAATDDELAAAVTTLTAALSGKQDASTAATDAEVAAAVSTINTSLAGKQDASTAATDTELSAALTVVNAALAGKQDAATAATDAELAAAVTTVNAAKQDAATAATDTELAAEAAARDAAVTAHAAVKRGVHGIPASVASGDALVGDGTGGFTTVTPIPSSQKGAASGVALFSDTIVSTAAEMQAALTAARTAGGGVVRGVPGTTFSITAPLVIGSRTVLNVTGCTIAFANTAVRTNMLQNYAVAPVATATDVATTAGSATVTSPTLAAGASVGQAVAVVGAGPPGGDGGGAIWLYGTVASVVGNTITLSGNANGVAAHTTLAGATGYLFNRDSNITVVGGRWDGGTNWNTFADRQTFNSHQLRFRRVDGLTVRGVTVALTGFPQGGGWVFGVNPADCTDFLIEDITGDGSSTTVQGDGPLKRGIVRNVRGSTKDDMVAFGPVGFQGNDTEGDITGLHVDGIESNGSLRAFKMFGGLGSNGVKRIGSASVRSVKGSTVDAVVWVGDYVGSTPLTVEVDDITATPGTGKDSLTNLAPLGTIVRPSAIAFRPSDSGLKLASFDSVQATGSLILGGGFLYLVKLPAPYTVTVANLLAAVVTAGASLTAGQNLAGIYDSDGNLWAATADQSTAWTSLGTKVMALTAQSGRSLTLPGGPGVFYWAALLANGTTKPTFAATPPTATGNNLTANVGFNSAAYVAAVPGAKHRTAYESAGSRTALPSLAGLTLSDNGFRQMIWAACT